MKVWAGVTMEQGPVSGEEQVVVREAAMEQWAAGDLLQPSLDPGRGAGVTTLDQQQLLEADHSGLRTRVPPWVGGLMTGALVSGEARLSLAWDPEDPLVVSILN